MDIDLLRIALKKSRNAAYVWDYATGNISWEGNIKEVFGLELPETISNRRGFLAALDTDYVEKFSDLQKHAVQNGGDYCFSYSVVMPDRRLVIVTDRGTVVSSISGDKLIGSIYVEGLKPAGKSQLMLDSMPREFRDEFAEIYKNALINKEENILLEVSIDNLPMIMTFFSGSEIDRIIRVVENNIGKIIRAKDALRRTSTDRFHIILRNYNQLQAEAVVNRVLKVIQLSSDESAEEVPHLRCSIGSVAFPANTDDYEDALKKVSLALNVARSRSDRFYCDYNEAHKEFQEETKNLSRVHSMNRAFDESRMHLAFQPIVDARTGGVYSYECLLRLKDEQGKFIPVGELITAAERLGTIEIIDNFVIEKAVEELKNYPQLVLNINVSNLTTDNQRWLKKLGKLIFDETIARRVIIEITETAAQRDMRQTAYFVASIQALGCKVALDDFGAGYTSFRQIKSLSVDMIKIDGAYVADLTTNSENMVFVKTLLDFSKNYGLKSVAECIESGDIAKVLIDSGADYLQGYYFGRPEMEPEFKKLINHSIAS